MTDARSKMFQQPRDKTAQQPAPTHWRKAGIAQPKPVAVKQARQPPTALPVYRPQSAPKVLQPKLASQQPSPISHTPRRPVAPPVYRPQTKPIVQPKMATAAHARKTPSAPPVYRPQPTPKVLQAKQAQPVASQSKRTPPRAQESQLNKPAHASTQRPGGAQSALIVQRKTLVAQPPPRSWLPDPPDSLEAHEKIAREGAKKHWAYIENYETIWGRYPWEPKKREANEYKYEPDPKQVGRDRLAYCSAKAQLREEALIRRAAKGHREIEQILQHAVNTNPVARGALAQIEMLQSEQEDALTNWGLFVFLHEFAETARALISSVTGTEEKIAKLKALVKQGEECFGRQIIHPDDLARFAERPDHLYNHLTMGLQSLAHGWNTHTEDRPRFVQDVLRHDKGYPRAINFANQFVPSGGGALRHVISNLLHGFSNTDLYTKRPSKVPVPPLEQIRNKYAQVGNTGEFWKPILESIGMKVPGLDYEKVKVVAFVRQYVNQLCDALSDVIGAAQVRQFIRSQDLEEVCDDLYMS